MRDLIKEKIGRNTFSRAILREFVWTPQQIEKLLDSIMWIQNSIDKRHPFRRLNTNNCEAKEYLLEHDLVAKKFV